MTDDRFATFPSRNGRNKRMRLCLCASSAALFSGARRFARCARGFRATVLVVARGERVVSEV